MYSHLPDILVSYALHRQLQAHQQERAVWANQQPSSSPHPSGPVMPKSVPDLKVGDLVGVGSSPDKASLWCEVKNRQGDIGRALCTRRRPYQRPRVVQPSSGMDESSSILESSSHSIVALHGLMTIQRMNERFLANSIPSA